MSGRLSQWLTFFLIGGIGVLLFACQQTRTLQRSITPPDAVETLDQTTPFLKAHMQNGDVYVLANWNVQTEEAAIQGYGHLLNPHRDTIDQGAFSVPLEHVALFETNVTETSGSVIALSIITGASLGLTAYCATNPKACFGSCPTFYAPSGADTLLQAEGFSSSIAPSLERRDVDALYRAEATGPSFNLQMTNEALETHVVRTANLLLAPRPSGGRVARTADGTFWGTKTPQPPVTCLTPEGDCRPLIAQLDGREYYSPADSTDLATKEVITLTFDSPPEGPVGILVGARQTLMTTFLLYQTLAYMGNDVGTWMAMLERNQSSLRKTKANTVLGAIEVWMPDSTGAWTKVGEAGEHGPLATDVHLVPLPTPPNGHEVQLRLTKGNWRLDHLSLVQLTEPLSPVRLTPSAVTREKKAMPKARAQLLDSTQALITLPGDVYTFSYELPDDTTSYELFLESKGYYLEWMREEWMEETNPARVADMLFSPEEMMKTLAPAFKRVEGHMEDAFWNSRYER